MHYDSPQQTCEGVRHPKVSTVERCAPSFALSLQSHLDQISPCATDRNPTRSAFNGPDAGSPWCKRRYWAVPFAPSAIITRSSTVHTPPHVARKAVLASHCSKSH